MSDQFTLFGAEPEPAPALPEGFRYRADVITADDERTLLAHVETLPFREFEFHGYVGKRRTVSFGWRYDFAARTLDRADDIPAFLLSLRDVAARFADLSPDALQQVLVTEYDAGAGIGWHRDKAVFGDVVGISLLAPCRFRLRRQVGDAWERVSLVAEPRSAYLLRGASRTEWEHSIPAVDARRYSITFRNLRERRP
ncbi:alpha-ketoglutarate-dependent dioxygenase AlkB [Roseisolibacter agri]|uniref:2OG-Fe(II) oxygenase n=1 Tax=Roseisolibacter agri TaxID=2014610 RepID=A0AA37QFR7_9BACT|nr:alpha-ketoglutarate-dependent dioxygenase AlkB [Roseisolibacter agri]GLC24938.1 2OG-Fe(II) oxygenase [Roseisolibacter agri]